MQIQSKAQVNKYLHVVGGKKIKRSKNIVKFWTKHISLQPPSPINLDAAVYWTGYDYEVTFIFSSGHPCFPFALHSRHNKNTQEFKQGIWGWWLKPEKGIKYELLSINVTFQLWINFVVAVQWSLHVGWALGKCYCHHRHHLHQWWWYAVKYAGVGWIMTIVNIIKIIFINDGMQSSMQG